jgi:hypothetical protein
MAETDGSESTMSKQRSEITNREREAIRHACGTQGMNLAKAPAPNFGVKLARPGFGPAAELPAFSPA